jgi:hypothetical protein
MIRLLLFEKSSSSVDWKERISRSKRILEIVE